MARTEAWFDRMYEDHHRQVLAYCARRAALADAASEVFTVAWRRRDDIPGGDRALPWLYGVARNVLSHQRRTLQRFRRLTTRVAGVQRPPPPTPDAVVVQREEYTQVREAVGQLRDSDREVLLLSASRPDRWRTTAASRSPRRAPSCSFRWPRTLPIGSRPGSRGSRTAGRRRTHRGLARRPPRRGP